MSNSHSRYDDTLYPRNTRTYPYFNRALDVKRALRPLAGLHPCDSPPVIFDAVTLCHLAQDRNFIFGNLLDTSEKLAAVAHCAAASRH